MTQWKMSNSLPNIKISWTKIIWIDFNWIFQSGTQWILSPRATINASISKPIENKRTHKKLWPNVLTQIERKISSRAHNCKRLFLIETTKYSKILCQRKHHYMFYSFGIFMQMHSVHLNQFVSFICMSSSWKIFRKYSNRIERLCEACGSLRYQSIGVNNL